MPVASILGWSGVVLGTWTIAAQAVRIRRRGGDGVNATTWSLFLFMSGFWLAYGAATGSAAIVASTLLGAPVMVVLLHRLDPAARRRGMVNGALAVAAVAAAPALLYGWDAGLLGIGILVLATRLPQLRQLVRADHAHGVSVGAWACGSANVAVWLGYDLATARGAAALTMAAALLANAAIVAMALARHRSPSVVATARRRAVLAAHPIAVAALA